MFSTHLQSLIGRVIDDGSPTINSVEALVLKTEIASTNDYIGRFIT